MRHHEARGTKHGRKGLRHLSLHSGYDGNGYLVKHHYADGSAPTEYEFAPHEDNEAVAHVVQHWIRPGQDEAESSEGQPENYQQEERQ